MRRACLITDYAINVCFAERDESFWFALQLIEFLDHGAGMEVTIAGVPKKWNRTETGDWREESTEAKSAKPWWRFWE